MERNESMRVAYWMISKELVVHAEDEIDRSRQVVPCILNSSGAPTHIYSLDSSIQVAGFKDMCTNRLTTNDRGRGYGSAGVLSSVPPQKRQRGHFENSPDVQ
jgi:hypothetical protein